ncbi:MAG: adenylyl-sulfate kinase [Methylacidiphilales bacterium]|nr:adenylyl-sulfate kinase [Candidatus Methylacidiphilales bacterium]MDW8349445.1 adenylyl-sulfate kinase [Verrucomicrobiae bacterium]
MSSTAPSREKLRIVIVGHVDHGKSTLIGRLLFDTGSVPEGKYEQLKAAAEAEGMDFEYAFLLDALLEEQEQNITIDTTQIPFRTATRDYVIIDAPGHKEFLKNMITGAASADAAILLIAANEGIQEQSRRHGYLLSLLGIRQIIVAVNKMDTVHYDQKTFEQIQKEYTDFLKELNITPTYFIPISARYGVNITHSARDLMPWCTAPAILEALAQFTPPSARHDMPLRLPVQDVYRFDDRRIIAGRIEAGTLRVGDEIEFLPDGKRSRVKSFETWPIPQEPILQAEAGRSVAITLTEQIFIRRGHIAQKPQSGCIETHEFRANVFWIASEPLRVGSRFKLRLTTQEVEASLITLHRVIDTATLVAPPHSPDFIGKNEVGEVTLRTRSPIALDLASFLPETGRFVIIGSNGIAAGGGIVLHAKPEERRSSENIVWADGGVSREMREARNLHRGAVLWFTGLSGSGKTTLAVALERDLFRRGYQTFILDGDNLRFGLNRDLDFSPAARSENIRRASEVAKLMAEAGLIVITSFISPYRLDRERARAIITETKIPFIEIYINAPLEVCQKRDPKGLYAKALAGEIKNFTGISAPYEPPENPEIEIRTDLLSPEKALDLLLDRILPQLQLKEPETSI